jgi:hypothetical protein
VDNEITDDARADSRRTFAHSLLFREMLEAGTRGGPIGLEEISPDLLFIFDRVTKKEFDGKFPTSANAKYYGTGELVRAIELEGIARKYMFDTVSASFRRYISRYANQDPLQALAFAANLQPPDAAIAQAAFQNFKDQFYGQQFQQSLSGPYAPYYTPAPENLNWSFVKEKLGLRAYYAYVKAMQNGRKRKPDDEWDWERVASSFIKELGMTSTIAFI